MKRALAIVLGGLTLAGGTPGPALAGDPEAGRKIANMCRTCHGVDGYAQIPNRSAYLCGRNPGYARRGSSWRFKTGERENTN